MRTLIIAVLFAGASASNAAEPPFVAAIANEPPPRLIVEPPLPGPLARGAALIPYRVENVRIVPVLGADARKLSPRVGHLHVSVDDLPWRWGDFSGTNTIVITGLPAGPHKILVELADPEHGVFAAQTVTFTHNDEVYDRSVDVQIGRLRRKIQPRKDSAELIRTERGAGYVFTAPVEIVR